MTVARVAIVDPSSLSSPRTPETAAIRECIRRAYTRAVCVCTCECVPLPPFTRTDVRGFRARDRTLTQIAIPPHC